MRPVIGITTSLEDDEQRLRLDYVRAVERAGGLPFPLPMVETEEAALAIVAMLDGLLLTGGPAVTHGLVGALPPDLAPTDPRRLESELRLLATPAAGRLPVLGICYGMQLLNALAGGTLYADVERQHPGALVHSAGRGGTDHSIAIRPGTVLRRIVGDAMLTVNTRHIQALASVGPGFRVAATAPDGVVEAIETPDGRVLAVQFHPERMGTAGAPLFEHLIGRARACREAKR